MHQTRRKRSFVVGLAIMLFAALALSSCGGKQPHEEEAAAIDTIPEMVMQIRKCSRLYTTECKIHKIVTHDDQLTMKGKFIGHDYNINLPLGQRKIAIPIDATVKAYVDLSAFTSDNVRKRGDKIEVVLPDPRIVVTATTIDHDMVKQYVPVLRRKFSSQELYNYTRQGRESIVGDIPKLGLVEHAQADAANIIIPIIMQLGYEEQNITVTFRKDFTPREIVSMVENSDIENGRKQ